MVAFAIPSRTAGDSLALMCCINHGLVACFVPPFFLRGESWQNSPGIMSEGARGEEMCFAFGLGMVHDGIWVPGSSKLGAMDFVGRHFRVQKEYGWCCVVGGVVAEYCCATCCLSLLGRA